MIGDQSRHFNQNPPSDYNDSRDYWSELELRKAVTYFKSGKICDAYRQLGNGLHSLQDKYAHRDWDTGPYGTSIHPTWYDDVNDVRNMQAIKMTEIATKDYLIRFINLISN